VDLLNPNRSITSPATQFLLQEQENMMIILEIFFNSESFIEGLSNNPW
jgi:hypothetical protein